MLDKLASRFMEEHTGCGVVDQRMCWMCLCVYAHVCAQVGVYVGDVFEFSLKSTS